MTTLIALGWAQVGSVISLALLWLVLGGLCLAILRRAARRGSHDLPRDL